MTVCKLVYYSGRVQGVGFRYSAQNLAKNYHVNGYVRNLPSGDVELIAEGPAGEVESFLNAIGRHMAGYIEQTSMSEGSPPGGQGFQIRY